jgi:triphosphoribosyl-dephospho-CoA synthase
MVEAAHRDRIAYQFSSNFADVFDRGMPWLAAASRRWTDPKWAALAVYLGFLAAFPDTHIVRKYGAAVGEEVRQTAMEFERRLQSEQPADLLADLLTWDGTLKQCAINPGTSADLTVATLFVHRLRSILPEAPNSG